MYTKYTRYSSYSSCFNVYFSLRAADVQRNLSLTQLKQLPALALRRLQIPDSSQVLRRRGCTLPLRPSSSRDRIPLYPILAQSC
jgi:hypothetical protein